MCILSGIALYPIKSLDSHYCNEAVIGVGGSLLHDREWTIVDRNGKVVNGKRSPKLFGIRARYDLRQLTVELSIEEGVAGQAFHVVEDRSRIESWFEDVLGFPVMLKRNDRIGFPDDEENWGPTVIGKASLAEVARWYGLQLNDAWRRFRINLVVSNSQPFWEDRLVGKEGSLVPFVIGDVKFLGAAPCPRCIVPTRDPFTASRDKEFQKIFVEKRKSGLPTWVEPTRFDHYFRLSVNTRIDPQEAGKRLKIGDKVSV